MRVVVAILVIGALSGTVPARAQTYDPNYPVCLQIFGRFNSYECRYTSLAQCAGSASGRAAECVLNPYAANAIQAPGSRQRRYRAAY